MTQNKAQTQPPQSPPAPTPPRSPEPVYGIDVNNCKNPGRDNFEVPVGKKAGYGTKPYTIVAVGAKMPAVKCNLCGEIFALKSNQGSSRKPGSLIRAFRLATHFLARFSQNTLSPNVRAAGIIPMKPIELPSRR